MARYQYDLHHRRDVLIGGLCGDPAWDMLLALFIARADGLKIPVKNVCLATRASTSTAMRRLDGLFAAGLLRRTDDAQDARRSLIELSERGYDAMVALLRIDD